MSTPPWGTEALDLDEAVGTAGGALSAGSEQVSHVCPKGVWGQVRGQGGEAASRPFPDAQLGDPRLSGASLPTRAVSYLELVTSGASFVPPGPGTPL